MHREPDMRLVATTRSSSSARAGAFGVNLPRPPRSRQQRREGLLGRAGGASGAAAIIPPETLESVGVSTRPHAQGQ